MGRIDAGFVISHPADHLGPEPATVPALQSADPGQFFTESPFSPAATLVARDKVLSPRPLPWSRDSTGTDIEHRIWQEDDKVKGR